MTFGEKLLELRKRSAMSQDMLAERLDVSRQAVSKWERDEAIPETDKIVRIAQIFGVTTDYLLLDTDPFRQPEAPHYQTPPQAPYAATFFGRVEQFIRRHGYKFGYLLMAIGALICVMSIGMRLLWPVITEGFLSGFWETSDSLFDSFDSFGNTGGQIWDENGNPVGSLEDILGDIPIVGADGKPLEGFDNLTQGSDGIFDDFQQSAQQSMNKAVQAQANLFLIGLFPGLFLIGAGLFVVIKGKQMVRESEIS